MIKGVDSMFPHSDDPIVHTADINQIATEIRALCRQQPFAVLATQGDGQPYTSLISFAVSLDLKHLVFGTPLHTRKFSLLSQNPLVAVMVDNRAQQSDALDLICGVTITGQARPLTDRLEIDFWSDILTDRHSYLAEFISSPSSRLVLISTRHFYYVRRFQEVYQWTPDNLQVK